MNMRRFLILLIIFITPLLVQCQPIAGYTIDIKIDGLRDSSLYLAYHLGNRQYIKDTLKLDSEGKGTFNGNEKLPGGIYMVVLPGRSYFEILIDDDQVFSVNCRYNNFHESLSFSGSSVNSSFIDYQKKWGQLQQKGSAVVKRIQANKSLPDSVKILTDLQKSLEADMKSYLSDVISSNRGNILATLVKAILPVEVPEFTVPTVVKNRDSLLWVMRYNYNKDHFFDNIDFSDERILRTPILHSRLDAYFSNVLIQHPDSLISAVDMVVKSSEANYKVFQYVAVYVFNHFRESQIMGHDAVLLKIADDVYLSGKADWVSKEFIEDLTRQTELIRNNLIGMVAKDLVMDSYNGVFVALHDIDKEFTIVYFWEPNCGHCKESTPKLLEYYNKSKDNGIEVFAVCTTSDKKEWSEYIDKNKLTWINGWDPDRRTHFDYYYNVQSTPMIYILNKDKKIIAKKLSVDDIPSFIENYRKYN